MNIDSIVKTPVELELEKIKLSNFTQFKNIELEYHMLRILNEIMVKDSQLVGGAVFHRIFEELLAFDEIESVRMLPLF